MADLAYYITYLSPALDLEYSNLVTLVPYARNNTSQTNADELTYERISLFQFVGQLITKN